MRAYTELSFLALPAIETLVVFYVFTLIGVHLQFLAGVIHRLFFSVFSITNSYPSRTFFRISWLGLINLLMNWTRLK